MTGTSTSRCPMFDRGCRQAGNPWRATVYARPDATRLLNSKAGRGLSALMLDTGEEVCRTRIRLGGDVPGLVLAQSAGLNRNPGLASGRQSTVICAPIRRPGKTAWDQDTKGDDEAVNGVAAKGGSIDGGLAGRCL